MIDDRDRKILSLLQIDSDMPVHVLGERVNLSPSACSRRLARLKEMGYIARNVAVLDRARMGLPTTIFVLLRTDNHSVEWLEKFQGAVRDISEIVEVHRLTGNFDYIVKIVLPNVESYDDVYKQLVRKVKLFDVSAYISMETVKDELSVPTGYAS